MESQFVEEPLNPSNPQGFGNPKKTNVNKMEQDTIIQQIKGNIIKREKCLSEIESYENCVCEAGLFLAPIKCKKLKIKLYDCVNYWHECDEILARAKKHYVAARTTYRTTGVGKTVDELIEEALLDCKN